MLTDHKLYDQYRDAMNKRFSKTTVANVLYAQIQELRKRYNFDPSNGYAQVEGKGEEINRAYGIYSCLKDKMDHFELWDYVV